MISSHVSVLPLPILCVLAAHSRPWTLQDEVRALHAVVLYEHVRPVYVEPLTAVLSVVVLHCSGFPPVKTTQPGDSVHQSPDVYSTLFAFES